MPLGSVPLGEPDKKRKQKGGGRLIIIGVLLIALSVMMLGVIAVAYRAGDVGTVFPNIYVGDQNLGGKTAEEALAILNDTYYGEKIRDVRIPLFCEDAEGAIPLNDLAVTYQNQEVVGNALEKGAHKNPIIRGIAYLYHRLHRTDLEPVIAYENEALLAMLSQIAKPYETEPVGYTFQIAPDHVTLYGKVNGVKVDRDAAVCEVERQIKAMAFEKVLLEPKTVEPAPIEFSEFYQWLISPAQDAYYEKDDSGKVVVHPEKLQCSVDEETVRQAIRAVDTAADNTTTFSVTTTPPALTESVLKEHLYADVLGSYSTYFGGTAARINNVRLAASRINGYEMLPGDEFSYDKTILPRKAANGYQAAPVYVGNKVESGMGGGICQGSSTLYCAALYANLKVVERHNHTLKVGNLPPGLDATIAEGYLDLRLQNSTPYPIRFDASADGGKLTFTVRGYNPEQTSVELLRSGGGYSYGVTRLVKKNGAEVLREKLPSSQYQPPAPSETPKPTAATTEKPKTNEPKEPNKSKEAKESKEPQKPAENPPPAPSAAPAPESEKRAAPSGTAAE